MSKTKIIRLPALLEQTGLSPATIWRREQEGSFPKRLKLGPRSVGWREEEITAWINSRPCTK